MVGGILKLRELALRLYRLYQGNLPALYVLLGGLLVVALSGALDVWLEKRIAESVVEEKEAEKRLKFNLEAPGPD